MNRSKSAALLMLIGSVALGGASGFTIKSVIDKDRLCAPRQSERDYRVRVYSDLGLSPEQVVQWDSLIDARRKAVAEVYAPARLRADSITARTREQQRALLTDEQRARLDERLRQQAADRQKQNDQQKSDKNKQNTPRPNP
jgi:Spy/CpxP family protein refolding chaperone